MRLPKQLVPAAAWAFLIVRVAAGIPEGYYLGTAGLSGTVLKSKLHDIIDEHTQLPYNSSTQTDTREALKVLEQDPANPANVLLFYLGRSDPKTMFGAAGGWDREHLWPRSYGVDGTPAERDLFNLRVTDMDVNNTRGNKHFDVSNPLDSQYRNPAHVEAPGNTSDADSWEPPGTYKGDVARSLFYLDVRYEGGGGEPDLRLTSDRALITNSGMYMGLLATLMAWHTLDPVDAREQERNDLIFAHYQHNRNPFIDHPEWVTAVYAPVPETPGHGWWASLFLVSWIAARRSWRLRRDSSADR